MTARRRSAEGAKHKSASVTTQSPIALILATLDTKADIVAEAEATFTARGVRVAIVDIGSTKPRLRGRFSVLLSIRSHLRAPSALHDRGSRQLVIDSLASALHEVSRTLLARVRPSVIFAAAGTGGTGIVLPFFATLPTLLPKVLLTTLDPGHDADLVSNLVVFRSGFDLEGSHPLLNSVVAQAAEVACALANIVAPRPVPASYVALSQLGVTTPCGKEASRALLRRGLLPLVFHAVGGGGVLLERYLREGIAGAALDLTLSDITTALLGGLSSSNPQRLATPAQLGVPMVVVPGAVNSAIFGPLSSLPRIYRSRKLLTPTPSITVLRVNARESARIGREIGRSLNVATRRVDVLIPQRGFSSSDIEGGETARDARGGSVGPWFDPEANHAFVTALRDSASANPFVQVTEVDAHINDPRFARLAVRRLSALLRRPNDYPARTHTP